MLHAIQSSAIFSFSEARSWNGAQVALQAVMQFAVRWGLNGYSQRELRLIIVSSNFYLDLKTYRVLNNDLHVNLFDRIEKFLFSFFY